MYCLVYNGLGLSRNLLAVCSVQCTERSSGLHLSYTNEYRSWSFSYQETELKINAK